MDITVELYPRGEERKITLQRKSNGLDLIRELGFMPDAHILVRDNVPIPIDDELRDGERIRVIAVVSGG